MVIRNIKKRDLPDAMSPAVVADIIQVNRQTVVNAAGRLGLGVLVEAGTTTRLVLSPDDVIRLSRELQDGPGNPNWRKKK